MLGKSHWPCHSWALESVEPVYPRQKGTSMELSSGSESGAPGGDALLTEGEALRMSPDHNDLSGRTQRKKVLLHPQFSSSPSLWHLIYYPTLHYQNQQETGGGWGSWPPFTWISPPGRRAGQIVECEFCHGKHNVSRVQVSGTVTHSCQVHIDLLAA